MLGLGAYSSGSEDESHNEKRSQSPKEIAKPLPEKVEVKDTNDTLTQEPPPPADELSRPLVGPFRPAEPTIPSDNSPPQSRRPSPFSSTQALIRDMTLPPIPNLDIPPSPTGSPNPAMSKKFEHFLSLKKQGVHFNEKLASSSSLKNPSLLSKMMEHAGIDKRAQYSTSLPPELWDVSVLPAWGYKEELQRRQQEIRQKLEERKPAQRDAIDFVSASTESSRSGTPAGSRHRQSAAERVLSGLRDTKSPHTSETAKRYDLERRPRRSELRQTRHSSRSPPGRRKRSRSR